MKQRYRLFRRSWGMFYWIDDTTGQQGSLKTKESAEAKRLIHAKNETVHLPSFNLRMARVYLQASDPKAVTRTWQYVMDQIIAAKKGDTQHRWKTEAKSKAYDCLRDVLLVETQAEHFLRVLTSPKVSTNVHLRRIHNFALDMNWLGCGRGSGGLFGHVGPFFGWHRLSSCFSRCGCGCRFAGVASPQSLIQLL